MVGPRQFLGIQHCTPTREIDVIGSMHSQPPHSYSISIQWVEHLLVGIIKVLVWTENFHSDRSRVRMRGLATSDPLSEHARKLTGPAGVFGKSGWIIPSTP